MNKSLLGLKRGSEKLPLTHEIGPNFPSGFTCIGASKCKCTVHQNKEGKRSLKTYDETKFHCYSALENCNIQTYIGQGGLIIG